MHFNLIVQIIVLHLSNDGLIMLNQFNCISIKAKYKINEILVCIKITMRSLLREQMFLKLNIVMIRIVLIKFLLYQTVTTQAPLTPSWKVSLQVFQNIFFKIFSEDTCIGKYIFLFIFFFLFLFRMFGNMKLLIIR